jgi:hypothetical protein
MSGLSTETDSIESISSYRIIPALSTFDSDEQHGHLPIRGFDGIRQIVLKAEDLDIHLRLKKSDSGVTILGQVLGRDAAPATSSLEVHLLQDNKPVDAVTTSDLGEFLFRTTSAGAFSLEILIRSNLSRILGTFSI